MYDVRDDNDDNDNDDNDLVCPEENVVEKEESKEKEEEEEEDKEREIVVVEEKRDEEDEENDQKEFKDIERISVPIVSLTPSRLQQIAQFEAENDELMLTFHDLANISLGRTGNGDDEEEDEGILSEDSLEDLDERFEMEVRRAQRTAEKKNKTRKSEVNMMRKARIRAKLLGKVY